MATGTVSKHQEEDFLCEDLTVSGDTAITGDVAVTGDLAVTGTITGDFQGDVPHGQMFEYTPGTPTEIDVTTAGTYYGWVSATAFSAEHGVTFAGNATADRLVLGVAGEYIVTVQISFSGTGNAVIDGALHKNDVLVETVAFRRKIGTGGDTGSASATGLVYSDGDDYVDFRFTSDGNGDDVDIHTCSVALHKL